MSESMPPLYPFVESYVELKTNVKESMFGDRLHHEIDLSRLLADDPIVSAYLIADELSVAAAQLSLRANSMKSMALGGQGNSVEQLEVGGERLKVAAALILELLDEHKQSIDNG